jgi:hypothetical protein
MSPGTSTTGSPTPDGGRRYARASSARRRVVSVRSTTTTGERRPVGATRAVDHLRFGEQPTHTLAGVRARPLLADGFALVAFATAGLLTHEGHLSAAGYARTALPFLAGWYGAALVAGVYRRPTWTRLLTTCALGVTAALALRGLALGEAPAPPFVAVSFAAVLALVLGTRLVLGVRPPRRERLVGEPAPGA